jgi:hypothetical protein
MAELSNKKHNKTIEELVSAIVKARVSPKESLSRSEAAEKELDLEKALMDDLSFENFSNTSRATCFALSQLVLIVLISNIIINNRYCKHKCCYLLF